MGDASTLALCDTTVIVGGYNNYAKRRRRGVDRVVVIACGYYL